MNELIQITTGGQGLPVVSGRELYEYLGFDASQWSRWSKKNIVNNPYAKEGDDWQTLDLVSKAGPVKDYALTLDFAKRLSMLARTDKGESVRAYFLDCERKANQETSLLPIEKALLQQGELIDQLRADIKQLLLSKRSAKPPHLTTAGRRPPSALRQTITQRISKYCEVHQVDHKQTYDYIYKRLYEVYGLNVHRLIRAKNESLLDALERYNYLDRLYSLVLTELTYPEE